MWILKRILFLVPTLLVISFLAFILVRMAPGSPFDRERKPASPEIERALNAKYHLDEPVWKQYARYMGGVLRGDFGPSLKYRNHTVNDIVKQGLPVSMLLGITAFLFAQGVGIPLGFYSGVRRGKTADHIGSTLAIVAVCVPAFVIGPLLIMFFAIRWKFVPAALWGTSWHIILPSIALGLYFSGRIARLMREGVAGVLNSEFVMTARAKGLPEFSVLTRHVFRLAVLPVVSYSGPLLADLLTGSFVVENIFRIPGIGVFLVNSSLNRDYPMLVGLVLIYAALLLVLNLIVDFAYTRLDPRVRYA